MARTLYAINFKRHIQETWGKVQKGKNLERIKKKNIEGERCGCFSSNLLGVGELQKGAQGCWEESRPSE